MADILSDEQKVQLAQGSLAFYIGWAHKTDMDDVADGFAIPQPHHEIITSRMSEVSNTILQKFNWRSHGQSRHTAVVAPPGSAKTTLMRGFYEWIIGKASLEWGEGWADKLHIGHISHSADQAWRMSLSVRNTIEGIDTHSGPIFKKCFPDVKPSAKWAEKEWRVDGCVGIHPTFAALGIDGSIPGFRWNLVGLDDLIKPEEVRSSGVTPADVESIIYTLEKVVMKRLVEGGCAFLTNTRWFERDPTSWAIEPEPEGQGWTPIVIQALNENDESFWEDREIFSSENLKAERLRDPEGFALQFQGEPAPAEGIDFKREWLSHTYSELPWKDSVDRLNFFIVDCWDTASTTNPRSDESAGWKAAVDMRTWQIYMLNLYHDKLETPEVIDAIRGSAVAELAPQFVWIEDKSSGSPAQQILSRELGKRIIAVKPYGEKGQDSLEWVIRAIKPMLAAGMVLFPTPEFLMNRNMSWLGDAMTALLGYPRLLHDDIPRAFIMLLFETLKLQAELGIIDVNRDDNLQWGDPTGGRIAM